MRSWLSDIAATKGRSDRELEHQALDAGPDRMLDALAGHWASTLRTYRRATGDSLIVHWRLTLPNGFYALNVSTEPGTVTDTAFPGPPPIPPDLIYQWYVLGLLRVLSGEHEMTYAFERRWVAVSGHTATWRALRAPAPDGSLEGRLHRWPAHG